MHDENTPVLETDRLRLRKFTDNDITDMLLLYRDEEVNSILPWFPITTLAEMEAYLYERILPCYNKEVAYNYAITLKSDNRVIGYVHIDDIGGSNDIGYALRKEFWHKGITSEACMRVVEQLRTGHIPFITATHDVCNPYSGEVMKNMGMTYRYSYKEQWQPKNRLVTFRMYQRNLDGTNQTYTGYQNRYPHFLETGL